MVPQAAYPYLQDLKSVPPYLSLLSGLAQLMKTNYQQIQHIGKNITEKFLEANLNWTDLNPNLRNLC